jgi:hypothetical protein
MQLLFLISAFICLLVIAYQDLASRSIQWIYFPLLTSAGILLGFSGLHSSQLFLQYTACNLGFLLLQFLLLKAWFVLRYGRARSALGKKIGAGDILFLVAACTFFSPLNFILFYISSLLFSVGIYKTVLKRNAPHNVPLAGLQALWLMLSLCAGAWLRYPLLHDDWLILKIIYA